MAKTLSKPKKSGLTPEMQTLLEEARRTVKITPGNGKKMSLEPIAELKGPGPTIAEIIAEGRR
jgi:hypothetical protein